MGEGLDADNRAGTIDDMNDRKSLNDDNLAIF